MRDVLLSLDEVSGGNQVNKAFLDLSKMPARMASYERNEIIESLHKCENIGYINGLRLENADDPNTGMAYVKKITDKGYDFLYTARRDTPAERMRKNVVSKIKDSFGKK